MKVTIGEDHRASSMPIYVHYSNLCLGLSDATRVVSFGSSLHPDSQAVLSVALPLQLNYAIYLNTLVTTQVHIAFSWTVIFQQSTIAYSGST